MATLAGCSAPVWQQEQRLAELHLPAPRAGCTIFSSYRGPNGELVFDDAPPVRELSFPDGTKTHGIWLSGSEISMGKVLKIEATSDGRSFRVLHRHDDVATVDEYNILNGGRVLEYVGHWNANGQHVQPSSGSIPYTVIVDRSVVSCNDLALNQPVASAAGPMAAGAPMPGMPPGMPYPGTPISPALPPGMMQNLFPLGALPRVPTPPAAQPPIAPAAPAAPARRVWIDILGETAKLQIGLLVFGLTTDSNAYKAGLRVGDVVTQVNGKPVRSMEGLQTAYMGANLGSEFKVDYLRAGDSKSISWTLAECSSGTCECDPSGSVCFQVAKEKMAQPRVRLDLEFESAGSLSVKTVIAGGAGQKAGLAVGDELSSFDGVNLEPKTRMFLIEVLSSRVSTAKAVELVIARGGKTLRKSITPSVD
jgi:hypothetical protein